MVCIGVWGVLAKNRLKWSQFFQHLHFTVRLSYAKAQLCVPEDRLFGVKSLVAQLRTLPVYAEAHNAK